MPFSAIGSRICPITITPWPAGRALSPPIAGKSARPCAAWRPVVFMAVLLAMPQNGRAQDTVWIASEDGQGRTKLTGRVLDYTGQQLRLELPGGRQQDYPSAQVRGIETVYGQQQTLADEAFAQGQFEPALQLYRKAIESESRSWVRRQIAARMVVCYQALGQVQQAVETFLLLVRSDPDTPDFGCIPLAWTFKDTGPTVQQAATQWLAKNDLPAAVLLGASHLLTGNQRSLAVSRLEHLTASADARIALLAQAQLWRTELPKATLAQVNLWEGTVERLPESLRGGPCFVVGQAYVRLEQWEKAATALLRVPILHAQQRPLAAAALIEAGGCLEHLGRRTEAAGLYREAAEKYPETALAAEAQTLLKGMRQQK